MLQAIFNDWRSQEQTQTTIALHPQKQLGLFLLTLWQQRINTEQNLWWEEEYNKEKAVQKDTQRLDVEQNRDGE